jgi:hypothetical protein
MKKLIGITFVAALLIGGISFAISKKTADPDPGGGGLQAASYDPGGGGLSIQKAAYDPGGGGL